MHIVLNGARTEVQDAITAARLLSDLGLRPETVVVERNESVVRRAELAAAILSEGDRVEIIQMIAGG
ncbi:MAG TPA: sulfur carrier protein ThiS [Candidatus Udaeobacter sp.]|nr:sulfur carrier protein ThiS [Candidatus Udaeobacter sp.]